MNCLASLTSQTASYTMTTRRQSIHISQINLEDNEDIGSVTIDNFDETEQVELDTNITTTSSNTLDQSMVRRSLKRATASRTQNPIE